MKREGHEEVSFFIGTEVEHSPAFAHKTLFVVGIQDASVILNMLKNNDCTHVYFGANQSFPMLAVNEANDWQEWEDMVEECLKFGVLCTLDLDSYCAEGLLEAVVVGSGLLVVVLIFILALPFGVVRLRRDRRPHRSERRQCVR